MPDNELDRSKGSLCVVSYPDSGGYREETLSLLSKYGFNYIICPPDTDLEKLQNTALSCCATIVFDPNDGNEEILLSSHIRKLLSNNRHIIAVCKKRLDFALNFYGDICAIQYSEQKKEMLHPLFIEGVCRHPECFNSGFTLPNDNYSKYIKLALRAHGGNCDAMMKLSREYMSGKYLPKDEKEGVLWLKKASSASCYEAVLMLGICNYEGKGCKKNTEEAYHLFCEAADNSIPEAVYRKGVCQFYGEGTDKNEQAAKETLMACREGNFGAMACSFIAQIQKSEGDIQSAIDSYTKASELGSSEADIEIYSLCSDGKSEYFNPTQAFEHIKKAYDSDTPGSDYRMGLCYLSGMGCARDENAAFSCFERGSAKEDSDSLCALGMCFENGIGCEKDYSDAAECYRRAVLLNNPTAMNNLGGCYLSGHGVEPNTKFALDLFMKASELGEEHASCRIGLCYQKGTMLEKDESKAVEYYKKAISQGSLVAYYHLALCQKQGIGTEVDYKSAFDNFRTASESGFTLAMYEMAMMLQKGMGIKQNEREAFRLLQKAAAGGLIRAKTELGNCYFSGNGTVRDYSEAFRWYIQASDNLIKNKSDPSSAEAAFHIGICYLNGYGTDQSRDEALKFFKIAAKAGNTDAAYIVGELYSFAPEEKRSGERALKYYIYAANAGNNKARLVLADSYVTSRSYSNAYKLYKKAADEGDPEAMFQVAKHLISGVGVEADATTAKTYFSRSARRGFAPAMLVLGMFSEEGRGTEVDIEEAEGRYREAISADSSRFFGGFELPERRNMKVKAFDEAKVTARYKLGMLLAKNAQSEEEYIEAYRYIAGAASFDNTKAKVEVTKLYNHGQNVKVFYSTDLYRTESNPTDKTIAEAMNKLGDMYFDGKGLTEKDDSAALRCYRISAIMGNVTGKYNLGWCLRHGKGCKENPKEAAKWLKEAADAGNPHAAYSYGLCCEEGSSGSVKNIREALAYYRKAAVAGHTDATKRYELLSGKK